MRLFLGGVVMMVSSAPSLGAGDVRVAVASNFAGAFREVSVGFEKTTGHRSFGTFASTGALFAQIANGAPFDVLLAADSTTPQRLESSGLAVPGSRFTYALGRLVLWSVDSDRVDPDGHVLAEGSFRHLALANPDLAPYGEAARAVLRELGLWERLRPRVVMGENITQTLQFVRTGNAELGFVALSQLIEGGLGGSRWDVPRALHSGLEQQAILLTRGRSSSAASSFLAYLKSPAAGTVIRNHGYDLPSSSR